MGTTQSQRQTLKGRCFIGLLLQHLGCVVGLQQRTSGMDVPNAALLSSAAANVGHGPKIAILAIDLGLSGWSCGRLAASDAEIL